MRLSVKQVGSYPPVYDVKFVPTPRGKLYRFFRYVAFLLLMATVGLLFPTYVETIVNKIPFFKKD